MNEKLSKVLASQRAAVSGLRFDQAPELFKDIESTKAQMRHAGQKIPPAFTR
ncbi:hypothetical protein [Luteibacter sp. E-22]|uniref:hypothetical protein n=1 Tax=Luteibacter sp. E-22 TaxID=3404050 RepID=UPI003CEF73F6